MKQLLGEQGSTWQYPGLMLADVEDLLRLRGVPAAIKTRSAPGLDLVAVSPRTQNGSALNIVALRLDGLGTAW